MAWKRKRLHSTRWTGYDEGLLLYLLGLGSPTFRWRLRATTLIVDLSMEENLRSRGALLRTALHTPTLTPLDRLP